MRESKVQSYHKVLGTAIVESDGGVGLIIHYAAFIDGENECCEPMKPEGLSAEVWKDSRVRIGKACLIHAKKLIRENIQVDQMETELASDPIVPPPKPQSILGRMVRVSGDVLKIWSNQAEGRLIDAIQELKSVRDDAIAILRKPAKIDFSNDYEIDYSVAFEPPPVEPGRLDPIYLPTGHPDKAPVFETGQDIIHRLVSEGHSAGEAYKIVKGRG